MHLQLAPAIAARLQEFLRLLEVVVKGLGRRADRADLRRDDFAGRQRRAIMHGHDADQVVIGREDDRRETPAVGDRLLHAVENACVPATLKAGRRRDRR